MLPSDPTARTRNRRLKHQHPRSQVRATQSCPFFPKHTRAQHGQHAPSCVRCQCKHLLRVRSVQRDAPLSGACRAPPPRSPMTWARAPCRRAAHGIRDTHVRLRSMHQHARQQERQRPTVYLLENSGEESKHLLIAYTAAEARVSDPHTPQHRRLGPIGPTRSPPGHQHRGSLA